MGASQTITTRMRFDLRGWIGAALFVIGPFVSFYGYWGIITWSGYSKPTMISLVLLLLGAAAFLIGCLLVLVGRVQHHVVSPAEALNSPLQELARRR
ncbi:hypothetical protein GCM10016234_29550 [Tianweitania populi]|uniref:Uncharacterized protein n=2 Tax=Tianweitania populi TaxID=1607949 RepID=A0A8J3DQE3_9HYPH|nr:hypothetical protein GCM10016234_29550 [Tianweitania populi]